MVFGMVREELKKFDANAIPKLPREAYIDRASARIAARQIFEADPMVLRRMLAKGKNELLRAFRR